MHRTDAPNYVVVAGKRWYKESPTPASVFGYHGANALQEEIAGVIEAEGIALRASGAIDAAANYTGQLNAAIDNKISILDTNLQGQIDAINTTLGNVVSDVAELKTLSDGIHAKYIKGCEPRFNSDTNVAFKDGYLVIVVPSTGEYMYVNITNSHNKKILNTAQTAFEPYTSGIGGGGVPAAVGSPVQNKFYYLFAIKDSTNPVDIILDSSQFAVNALAAYNTAYSSGGTSNIGYRYLGFLQILDPAETSVYAMKKFNQFGSTVLWNDTYTTTVQIVDSAPPGGEIHDLDKDLATHPTYGRVTPGAIVGNVVAITILDFDMFDAGGTSAELLLYKYLGGFYVNASRFTVFKDAEDNENLTKCYTNELMYLDSAGAVKVARSSANDMSIHTHTLGYIDPLWGVV